jgi:hypothetical protein
MFLQKLLSFTKSFAEEHPGRSISRKLSDLPTSAGQYVKVQKLAEMRPVTLGGGPL